DSGFAGYWTLRCMKCHRLTMPSHAVHNLQWECEDVKDGDETGERIKPETLTLECPACGHRHAFGFAQRMNNEGGYCDADGNEITGYSRRVGYQWGALACPRVFHWHAIAEAQMSAGSTADMYAQADFDNSWRGLWFRPRRKHAPSLAVIRRHCAALPAAADIASAFFSADTQDNGWFWVVRAVGRNNNLSLLSNGFARTIQEVKERWDDSHSGVRCVMGIIDEGGHGDMPKYVRQLVLAERGLYGYKGGAFGERWAHSKNIPKLILGNAKQYQADLLYYMYSQDDRSNNYWFIPPEETLEDEYMNHLAAMQKVNKKKHGDQYENYENLGQPDHYFDCEKQALCIIDVAYKELKAWRFPVQNLRRGIQKPQQRRHAPSLEM
ncbi:MAG: phage terminase large subunit family protein, partial [Gammaproteobacteria bacterium]|nr:phage terminase large subunit family protein [Gammaproteobacteria bacterium]